MGGDLHNLINPFMKSCIELFFFIGNNTGNPPILPHFVDGMDGKPPTPQRGRPNPEGLKA